MSRLVTLAVLAVALLFVSPSIVASLSYNNQLSAASGPWVLDNMHPVFIAKGLTGLTWDGKGFIGSYGIDNVPLVNISLDGHRVSRFAPSFVGKDEVYAAISNGTGGFPRGYLYVNSAPLIYEIDPTGSHVRLFSSPPGASRIAYVAFDNVGTWGYALIALDDNGLLWSIDSDGSARVIQNFSNFGTGQGLKPEGIAVAPRSFGALGGYLFITLEGAERIVAISPNDTSKVMTLYHFTNEEPERIVQIQPQSDLFLAEFDTGAMVRVPAANFSNYAGSSLLVITEGENEPLGTFNVLKPAGGTDSNITVTRIGAVPAKPHFEGVSFVPSSIVTSQASIADGSNLLLGIGTTAVVAGIGLVVAAVVVVVLVVFFFLRSSRRDRESAQ